MGDNRKCIILVPIENQPKLATDALLMELKDRGYSVLKKFGSQDINKTRSVMATQAMKQGYEELMWIDSDMVFDPDSIDVLRSRDLPIVCGLYCKKGPRGGVAGVLRNDRKTITFGPSGGLIEIYYTGMGFVYTKREVYDRIEKKFHLPFCENQDEGIDIVPYFYPLLGREGSKYRYLGEDYSFCERVIQSGYKIFADTTIRLGHIGDYRYSWEDFAGDRPRAQTFELELE